MTSDYPNSAFPADPEGCKYTKEHEWVLLEEEGIARVGISDYAVGELGDVVFISLPPAGTRLQQFEKFGEIESVKAVADLFSPVSGEVMDANMDLAMNPELVNQMPFGLGWMIRVRLDNPPELDGLMDSHQYDDYLRGLETRQGGAEH